MQQSLASCRFTRLIYSLGDARREGRSRRAVDCRPRWWSRPTSGDLDSGRPIGRYRPS